MKATMLGSDRCLYTALLFSSLLLMACSSVGKDAGGGEGEALSASFEEAPRRLDLNRRTVVQSLSGESTSTKQKFVEVDITEVVNPKKIRLSFEVHHLDGDGEKILLGTFGLFPPDNPGKFIVPTKGLVGGEGRLELSMVVLDEVKAEDRVQVELKRLSLREE